MARVELPILTLPEPEPAPIVSTLVLVDVPKFIPPVVRPVSRFAVPVVFASKNDTKSVASSDAIVPVAVQRVSVPGNVTFAPDNVTAVVPPLDLMSLPVTVRSPVKLTSS